MFTNLEFLVPVFGEEIWSSEAVRRYLCCCKIDNAHLSRLNIGEGEKELLSIHRTVYHSSIILKSNMPGPPERYLYFEVAAGLTWSKYPQNYVGGSMATGGASHVRQVKHDILQVGHWASG
jgi:hypothetical protein